MSTETFKGTANWRAEEEAATAAEKFFREHTLDACRKALMGTSPVTVLLLAEGGSLPARRWGVPGSHTAFDSACDDYNAMYLKTLRRLLSEKHNGRGPVARVGVGLYCDDPICNCEVCNS